MKNLFILIFIIPITILGADNSFKKEAWVASFQAAVNDNRIYCATHLVDELYTVSDKLPTFQRDSFCDEIGKECAIDAHLKFYPRSVEMLILMSRFCLEQSDPYTIVRICRDYLKTEIEQRDPITDSEFEKKEMRTQVLLNIIRDVLFPFRKQRSADFIQSAYKKLSELHDIIQQRANATDEWLILARTVNIDTSLAINRLCFLNRVARGLKLHVSSLKKSLDSGLAQAVERFDPDIITYCI